MQIYFQKNRTADDPTFLCQAIRCCFNKKLTPIRDKIAISCM